MTEYQPEVGDTVKIEVEVEHVYGDGSFDLKPLSRFANAVPVAPGARLELVRRKPPALKPGDVVYQHDGAYLVGTRSTHFTATFGDVINAGLTPRELADKIARNPEKYTVVKHERNTK